MLCVKSVFLPVNYSEVYRYKYIDSKNTIPIAGTADPGMEFKKEVSILEKIEFSKIEAKDILDQLRFYAEFLLENDFPVGGDLKKVIKMINSKIHPKKK